LLQADDITQPEQPDLAAVTSHHARDPPRTLTLLQAA
jgi:hypothetical protein